MDSQRETDRQAVKQWGRAFSIQPEKFASAPPCGNILPLTYNSPKSSSSAAAGDVPRMRRRTQWRHFRLAACIPHRCMRDRRSLMTGFRSTHVGAPTKHTQQSHVNQHSHVTGKLSTETLSLSLAFCQIPSFSHNARHRLCSVDATKLLVHQLIGQLRVSCGRSARVEQIATKTRAAPRAALHSNKRPSLTINQSVDWRCSCWLTGPVSCQCTPCHILT